jgi:hypothetical protein
MSERVMKQIAMVLIHNTATQGGNIVLAEEAKQKAAEAGQQITDPK